MLFFYAVNLSLFLAVVLDLDSDYLGFVVSGEFLGPAFRGLRGRELHLMASAVWGHCNVTLKYIREIEREWG